MFDHIFYEIVNYVLDAYLWWVIKYGGSSESQVWILVLGM